MSTPLVPLALIPMLSWSSGLAVFFSIGVAGTWLARRYAMRHQLLDHPGERRSHDTITPRGGGIAIVAALLVAIASLGLLDPNRAALFSAIGLGLVLVAGVGWADDHRPLSPWWRLGAHAAASLLLAWGVWHDGGGVAMAACAFALAMILVNVWNFMDGIDGLAASQALLVAVGYALLSRDGTVTWLAMALAAACAGFLPFNLPRARIFLGDVGSGSLGYALTVLAILLARADWARAPALLLPLSAFLIDASLTLVTRIARRERWWLPHTQHAYQRWAQRTRRHAPVTLAYAGWTMVGIAFMLITTKSHPAFMMMALGAGCLAGSVAWIWLRRPLEG